MKQYLPFGKEIIPTEEQVREQQWLFEQYDFFGIPYGILDGQDEGQLTEKDIDREQAKLLISEGKTLPLDLQERLLLYKKLELAEGTSEGKR
jgi:hypothetical protein